MVTWSDIYILAMNLPPHRGWIELGKVPADAQVLLELDDDVPQHGHVLVNRQRFR